MNTTPVDRPRAKLSGPTDAINARLAIRLHRRGVGWKRIGELLAVHRSRPVPYCSKAVQAAVRRWRRKAQQAYDLAR